MLWDGVLGRHHYLCPLSAQTAGASGQHQRTGLLPSCCSCKCPAPAGLQQLLNTEALPSKPLSLCPSLSSSPDSGSFISLQDDAVVPALQISLLPHQLMDPCLPLGSKPILPRLVWQVTYRKTIFFSPASLSFARRPFVFLWGDSTL